MLHDLFGVPFDDIGPLLDRSPVAAKKLASRARERLHGTPAASPRPTAEHLKLAEAFLSASQRGNMAVLLELLAPDVVRRVDRVLVPDTVPAEIRGSRRVAEETKVFAARASTGAVAIVDGNPGIILAPTGRLEAVLHLTIHAGQITDIDIIGDRQRLAAINVTLP